MKKWIPYLMILLAVAGTIAYMTYNKPHADAASERPEYSISPLGLVREFLDNEADANEKYLGKLVQVQGVIRTVVLNPNSATVTLETGDPMTSVLCEFETPAGLEALKSGQKVSIQGFCSGMLGGDMMTDVILNRCAL
ncbi:MAG: OB-fold putative lipoprotein [Saprospiraceae bacterium]|jgi:hypothetical protein|nr:OB-fold putative lipoprotein [Saprospiraceae bacterium]